MKISDITPIIRKLFAAYPNANPSNETIAVYVEFLADIPLEHLRTVVNQCIIESVDFPPSAGKVRQRYIAMITPERLSAADAWGMVLKQIMRVGHVGKPEFDDALVARVVKGMGWKELCLSEDQMVDRAHFIRLYNELAEQQQASYHETDATRQLTQQQREQGTGLRSIGAIVNGALPKLPTGEDN